MQALGLIETKGLLAAVESADAMLKAAEVVLLEKTLVGGGLVSIAVTGEVSAVSAAVEAGSAAVSRLNQALLISQHVIPRPDEELEAWFVSVKPLDLDASAAELHQEAPAILVSAEIPAAFDVKNITKAMLDHLIEDSGMEEAAILLDSLKVAKLRKLAREYKTIEIAGRMISKADKKTLLAAIIAYYHNQ